MQAITTTMTILHISDTHGQHWQLKELPRADVIVHSGDFTMRGTEDEVGDFVEWLASLPYRHKIFVAGNHDKCLYGKMLEGLPANCHYLRYSGAEVDGLRFWGVPMFKADAQNGELRAHLEAAPQDIDVLVTHQPPHGVLDTANGIHYGSRDILDAVVRHLRPRYHLFGHVHDSHGSIKGRTTFVNSSLMDERYNLVNKPQLLYL